MQFSESWLREWVDPPVSTTELAEQLTMAGLEVGRIEPAAPPFRGVVLGKVLSAEQHPNADKLRLCQVDIGAEHPSQIVCGAPNVAAGQTVAVATVGARLPGDLKIRKAKLRGIESAGMICSARELGLGEDSDGIMVLSGEGVPGEDFRAFLNLDDNIIELELTPNRGDCLGISGIAREAGVINRSAVTIPKVEPVPATIDDTFQTTITDKSGCPVYAGRVIRGIDNTAITPLWMKERLRRGGIRSIHPVVDVTNYVMLETGQPMHAFSLDGLKDQIVVRRAKAGEELELLDNRRIKLDDQVLVIADKAQVVALAGIMGGAGTGVDAQSTNIFLESAFFSPLVIAGRARRFGLHTDASHRFERGVAPDQQLTALERATALILDIAGGSAGPSAVEADNQASSSRPAVRLRKKQLSRLLGHHIDDEVVSDILNRLGFVVEVDSDGWLAIPPAFRFDITIEADLIEEIARIYGYDLIPEAHAVQQLGVLPQPESEISLDRVADLLTARGYFEAITFSFVDPALQQMLEGSGGIELANPIASDLSQMRRSLWPGLLAAIKLNTSRQQERVRLFESGLRFRLKQNEIKQEMMVAGACYGNRNPQQWAAPEEQIDFYDVKGDVEAMLSLTGEEPSFSAGEHPALHPGQSAQIVSAQGQPIGWVGALHPAHQAHLGLNKPVFLFEVLASAAFHAKIPVFKPVSRFPSLRRDISFLVDESISAAAVLDCVRRCGISELDTARIFDIYRDHGVDSGLKSVALGLILQDYCSTLTDERADAVVGEIKAALLTTLNAKIRD